MKTTLLTFSLLASGLAFAQTDWKARFPGAEAVYTQLSSEVNLRYEGGKVSALTTYTEDLTYLSDKGVKMMSRGTIYHSSFNELKRWDAYTQGMGSKKLKVSNTTTGSSREDYIFYDDSKETRFDFTGGAPGASRHLEYDLLTTDGHLLIPHYFDRYFPVGEGTLQVHVPEEVRLRYLVKGLERDRVKVEVTEKRGRKTYSFRITDLPGTPREDDAPDNAWYATHVIFFVEAVREAGGWKPYLSTPEDLYRHIYPHIKGINATLSPELISITDSLVKGAATDREKTARIYNWVQRQIKYVAFEQGMEGFVPRDASLVCSRRFGDCKDMSSILTAMLGRAGVPAYFAWIGTRDIPYEYAEVPLPISDNHMICAVKLDGKFTFLDGTDDGCIFGTAPPHIQGKEALISVSEKEFRIERVPVAPMEANYVRDTTFLQLGEQGLTGRLSVRMGGYPAARLFTGLQFRNAEEDEELLKSIFSRANNKLRYSGWKVEMNDDHSEVRVSAALQLPDHARRLGNEWYLNLNLMKLNENGLYDPARRKVPVENDYLQQNEYVTVLQVPDGYKATDIPRSAAFSNDVSGFRLTYTQAGNRVILTQQVETRHLMLQPSQFAGWNEVLQKILPHYKQTLVIQKI